ncbi:MAG TPA: ribonuclease Z [Myxococcales bacterium]|nr:ribonuclease Z [Myxococcales bacterium]
MLRLTFLGTSAAQPTLARGLSGIAVRREGELLLFDCGEGSQRQMMRFGTGFAVDAVFFTHFHADHYLGLLGFLRTLSMQGREAPLHLYGPSPATRLLDQAIHLGIDRYSFELPIHELRGGEVLERDGYAIHALPVDHGLPALGYALVEAARPGEFQLERARALDVPEGPLFGQLQHGAEVQLPDGRRVAPAQVLGPPRQGRRLVVSGDTRPCDSVARAAAGADLLVHEGTFAESERARALETRHSTAREAARLAKQAGVARLVLTHFSSRYEDDLGAIAREAREEHPGTQLAHDGLTVEIPLPTT